MASVPRQVAVDPLAEAGTLVLDAAAATAAMGVGEWLEAVAFAAPVTAERATPTCGAVSFVLPPLPNVAVDVASGVAGRIILLNFGRLTPESSVSDD